MMRADSLHRIGVPNKDRAIRFSPYCYCDTGWECTHTHTVCSAKCFSVRVSCQSFNSTPCCFREPEKRASEKKPAGSTSPPAGSPAPSTTPSSATIRSAFLPYAPAFSVILQCLKMVHALTCTHKVSVSTDEATSYRFIPFLASHRLTFNSGIHIFTWYLKKMWGQQECFCFSRTGNRLESAKAGSRQAAVDAAVQSAAAHGAVQPGPAVFHTLQHGKHTCELKYLHKAAGRYHIQHISYFIY